MTRTRLQLEADRRAATIRRSLAEDLRRFREDAGVTQVAVARLAGLDPSVVSRVEAGRLSPTPETYARIAAALGADFAARVYPQSGPPIRDRHQAAMSELVIGVRHVRWRPIPEVAVRRPVRGWIDIVLHDPVGRLALATELESDLRRIEQLIRWSAEKAEALGSAGIWQQWERDGEVPIRSRLLVVRWTRRNRDAVASARRLLQEAYPADPRDALEALTGTAAWPGAALLWARIDRSRSELVDGRRA